MAFIMANIRGCVTEMSEVYSNILSNNFFGIGGDAHVQLITTAPTPASDAVAEMQQRIAQMQAYDLGTGGRTLPTSPDVRTLINGDVRPGCSYSVTGSRSLALAFLQAASADGAWCAVLGMPDFGLEYAKQIGCRLDRLVCIPQLDAGWSSVVAALVDVTSMVLVAPPRTPSAAETHRIAPRLRTHGSALVATTPWPGATATLQVESRLWDVSGPYLRGERLTVTAQLKGRPIQREWNTRVSAERKWTRREPTEDEQTGQVA